MTGVKNPSRTCSILIRGSNKVVLEEADRSLRRRALRRSLARQEEPSHHWRRLAGNGMRRRSDEVVAVVEGQHGLRRAGICTQALDIIAYTLAENAGLQPIAVVTELRRRHAAGDHTSGISVRKGQNRRHSRRKGMAALARQYICSHSCNRNSADAAED